MSTQDDKDQLIKKLLEQGKTYREIMKIAHASPTTIKKIDNQRQQVSAPAAKSNRLKAFQIFDRQSPRGSNVYQVITELDISVQDAEKFQVEYLNSNVEMNLHICSRTITCLISSQFTM